MTKRVITRPTKLHRRNLISNLKDEVKITKEYYEFENDKKVTKYFIESTIGVFEGIATCHDEDKFIVWKGLQISKKRARRAYNMACKVYLEERYIIPITRLMSGYITEANSQKKAINKLVGDDSNG